MKETAMTKARRIKPKSASMLFQTLLLLFLVAACASQNPTSTAIPTATITVITTLQPLNLPGWEQVLPRKSTWDEVKSALEKQGYKIALSQYPSNPDIQEYGVKVDDPSHKAQIIGDVFVQNNQIIQVTMTLLPGSIRPFSDLAWKIVDPTKLLSTYGIPDGLEVTVIQTGEGPVAGVLALWQTLKVATSYTINVLPKDFSSANTLQLCLTPDQVEESHIWITSPDKDIAQTLAESNYLRIGTKFLPTLFTNAKDIQTVMQILSDGKCLETPVGSWFPKQ